MARGTAVLLPEHLNRRMIVPPTMLSALDGTNHERSADHRAYCVCATLGWGARWLEDEKPPSGASAHRRDQEPRQHVDGGCCHRFGAGAWASHFKCQCDLHPAWRRSNQSVGGNTPT